MSILISLSESGFFPLKALDYRAALSPFEDSDEKALKSSFETLVQDSFMGDGGTYRFRRFSRFTLVLRADGKVSYTPRAGRAICQDIRDNQLNGGVVREFAPLEAELEQNRLLQAVMLRDCELALEIEPEFASRETIVGVHQIRTVTGLGELGLPTPEGVHRDAERLTFQHFVDRHNAEGGAFSAYDEDKNPVYSWLQEDFLDSIVFTGSTWHSASPLTPKCAQCGGYRDVFLIDFDFAS